MRAKMVFLALGRINAVFAKQKYCRLPAAIRLEHDTVSELFSCSPGVLGFRDQLTAGAQANLFQGQLIKSHWRKVEG